MQTDTLPGEPLGPHTIDHIRAQATTILRSAAAILTAADVAHTTTRDRALTVIGPAIGDSISAAISIAEVTASPSATDALGHIELDDAYHALWAFGDRTNGHQAGGFSEYLIEAISRADRTNRARLAALYPGLVAAITIIQQDPTGMDKLRDLIIDALAE